MRKVLLWLFAALLFTLPFVWSAQTDELFEFNKMMFVYLGTVFIVGAWSLNVIQTKTITFFHTKWWWLLSAFLASQILSTIFSIDPQTSFFGYYSRFHGGLLSTLTYLALTFVALNSFNKKDWFFLLKTVSISSLLVALYALPEHYHVSLSCAGLGQGWTTACWADSTNPAYRIFGTFGQPNWLAAYLLMSLPISWWWFATEFFNKQLQSKMIWILPLVTTVLSMMALLFTGSRSGWLGLMTQLCLILMIAVLWLVQKVATKQIAHLKINLSFGIGLLLLASSILLPQLVWGTPAFEGLSQILQKNSSVTDQTSVVQTTQADNPPPGSTVLETGGTNSGKIRLIVWRGAVTTWLKYPLLGSGVETFAYSYYGSRPVEHNLVSEWDFLYNKAHNEILNYLSNTGIIGLSAYLAILIVFFTQGFSALLRDIWKSNLLFDSKNASTKLAIGAILLGQLGLLISNSLGFSTVTVGLLQFVWIAALLRIIYSEKLRNNKKMAASQLRHLKINMDEIGQNISQIIIGLAVFWFGLTIWSWWKQDILFSKAKANFQAGSTSSANLNLAYQQFVQLTNQAPRQAEYFEQRALVEAQLAASLQAAQQSTTAAQLAQEAINSINQANSLNPVHLNVWKSRAKVFIWLSALDGSFLDDAIESLLTAQKLAPTDPKITYNLALLYESLEKYDLAKKYYELTLNLKPNYQQAQDSYQQLQANQTPK